MKKIKMLILVVMTCISVIFIKQDISVSAKSKMTLAQLQAKFPHGKYWNHVGSSKNNPDGWTNSPCKHHGYNGSGCSYTGSCGCNNVGGAHGAIQCMGYAYKLGLDAFGSHPYYWKTYAGNTAKEYLYNELKAGDIIRYQNNHHSIFVTGVSGNTVTYTHCNVGGTCVIQWGRTISKKKIAETLTSIRKAPATFSEYGITVSYDLNGGKGTLSSHNIAYENEITVSSVKNISKTGYTLNGFYLYRKADKTYDCGNDGWQSEENIDKNNYEKKLYYSQDNCLVDENWTSQPDKQNDFFFIANWVGNSYTIQFDLYEGKGNIDSIDMIYGKEKTLPICTFVNSGYTFAGWNVYSQSQDKWLYTCDGKKKWYKEGTESTGYSKAVYEDKSAVSKLTSIEGDTIILYATWKPSVFNIIYEANGGIGSMDDTFGYYGVEANISENTYEKEGYTFIGWNVYSKKLCRWLYVCDNQFIWLEENDYYPLALCNSNTDLSTITNSSDDTVVLKAKWIRNKEWDYKFLMNIIDYNICNDDIVVKEVKHDLRKIINLIIN